MAETKSKRNKLQQYTPALVILVLFASLLLAINWHRSNSAQRNAALLYTYAREYQQTNDPARIAQLERLMIPLADRTLAKQASANPLLGLIPTINLILSCAQWVVSYDGSPLSPFADDDDLGMYMCMNNPSVMSRSDMITE